MRKRRTEANLCGEKPFCAEARDFPRIKAKKMLLSGITVRQDASAAPWVSKRNAPPAGDRSTAGQTGPPGGPPVERRIGHSRRPMGRTFFLRRMNLVHIAASPNTAYFK